MQGYIILKFVQLETKLINGMVSRPPPLPPLAQRSSLTNHSLFRDYGRRKHVPEVLLELLWRALTDVPHIHQVRADLTVELASPPTLTKFQAAIYGHRGSTSPGATGLTFSKRWPPEVTQLAHQCLNLFRDGSP